MGSAIIGCCRSQPCCVSTCNGSDEVTRMVRGEQGLRKAQQASKLMFGGSLEGATAADFEEIAREVGSSAPPAILLCVTYHVSVSTCLWLVDGDTGAACHYARCHSR